MKEIYFAAGCFWGAQYFFSQVDGVKEALCGYANGNTAHPKYEEVYTDTTGYAETVKVSYNPERVSLTELTSLFFTIINPLSLNRQGADEGTRYRTGVYYTDAQEKAAIQAVFQAEEAKVGAPLVVELEPLRSFYPAEERHQDYLDKNPGGYCHVPLKTFRYLRLYQDLKLILADEPDPIARMANTAALIQERLHFFWTGFYRVQGEELVLGPFQGPSACMRIGYGKGVCGTAWKEARTLLVPDVEAFPGHIACSSESRSEIVVPVMRGGKVTAVLDIDSKELAMFDTTDATWLERISCI
ncbi:MAG: peptide-methionine (S)-S-oxide reductase MsrA [Bacteroidales bacterium]|nr:peptide-methionine (S)-S-oxide reductase MsrA [Bacteroidales bacterium]